jgi:two-component sensor histidine kinase
LRGADGALLSEEHCPVTIALARGQAVAGIEATLEQADGTRMAVVAHAAPLHDAAGGVTGACAMLIALGPRHEIDALRRAQLGEFNHRVKNTLQMLQSLLGAAQREAASDETRAVLGDASRRIGAVAAAQDVMHGEQPQVFAVRPFLESLCRTASQTFGRQADIALEEASGMLPNPSAVPLALIFTELMTNAVRHGRAGRSRVAIAVRLTAEGETAVLTVRDDGPGFTFAAPSRRASGLGLVSGLARQLGGGLEVAAENGAQVRVRFGGPRTGR